MARLPHSYNFYRFIDYHQSTNWACGFVALSPFNECFVFDELDISPRTNNTLIIAEKIAEKSLDYKFEFDVIDPLAGVTQVNTTRSTIEDLNDLFAEFKRQGICEGAYFVPADTKSERGRLIIKERLYNSSLVKKPFNNEVVENGIKKYLPTLWIFAHCKQMRISLKNWREEKGKLTVAYSHFCTGLEFLMKDRKFRPPILRTEKPQERRKVLYFQGRR